MRTRPGSGSYGSFVFGIFLAAYCLAGLLCTLALRETRDRDLTEEPLPQGEAA